MTISVCMATYNGEKFIYEQLCSILSQLYENDELIISDNGSSDSTVDIIKSFNDKRIKLINCEVKSIVYNFENSLNYATGDIIFLSDQDDIWLYGKLEEIKKEISDCDLVVTDCKVVDENLNVLDESFFKLNKSGYGVIKNLYKNSFIGCCMAFDRKILNYALPFPSDIPMHDWWIGLIYSLFGKVKFVDKQLLLYRRHKNNASNTAFKSKNPFYKKINFRLIMLINLIYRYIKFISNNA